MKNLIFFVLSMILAAGAFAQTVYKQSTYIFHRGERIEGDHLPECLEGLDFIARKFDYHGINPNFAYKNTIYSVRTLDSNGKIIDKEVDQIGEILECEDWQTHFPAKLLAPVYYEITIGNKKYRAAGGGRIPSIPQYEILPGGGAPYTFEGYPEFGVTFLTFTSTVFAATEGKKGGMFYYGRLASVDGMPREYYDHSSTGVLQITTPQK